MYWYGQVCDRYPFHSLGTRIPTSWALHSDILHYRVVYPVNSEWHTARLTVFHPLPHQYLWWLPYFCKPSLSYTPSLTFLSSLFGWMETTKWEDIGSPIFCICLHQRSEDKLARVECFQLNSGKTKAPKWTPTCSFPFLNIVHHLIGDLASMLAKDHVSALWHIFPDGCCSLILFKGPWRTLLLP